MKIPFVCPHCKARITGSDRYAGKSLTCPKCAHQFLADPVASAAPIAARSLRPPPPPRVILPPPPQQPLPPSVRASRTVQTIRPIVAFAVFGGVVALSAFAFMFGQATQPYLSKSPSSANEGQTGEPIAPPNVPAPASKSSKPIEPPLAAEPTTDDVPRSRLSAKELYDKVAPAVGLIEVHAQNGDQVGQGSGFFIGGDGLFVTNAHVALADGASFLVIRMANDVGYFVDEVQAFDRENDLAILKTGGTGLRHVDLRDAQTPPGEDVFAIGNPLGLTNTISQGLVSSVRESKTGDLSLIQTTAAISPGSSGGPLVDHLGNVVGVTTMVLTRGQNLNFAVPAPAVKNLVGQPLLPQKISELTKPAPVAAASSPSTPFLSQADTLKGLTGVYIVIEDLDKEAKSAGLSNQGIRATVELRLRGAGVRVLTDDERIADPRSAYLYISVNAFSVDDPPGMVYSVKASFNQMTLLAADTAHQGRTLARTWETPGVTGIVGKQGFKKAIQDSVDDFVAHFANDYLAANPKTP